MTPAHTDTIADEDIFIATDAHGATEKQDIVDDSVKSSPVGDESGEADGGVASDVGGESRYGSKSGVGKAKEEELW